MNFWISFFKRSLFKRSVIIWFLNFATLSRCSLRKSLSLMISFWIVNLFFFKSMFSSRTFSLMRVRIFIYFLSTTWVSINWWQSSWILWYNSCKLWRFWNIWFEFSTIWSLNFVAFCMTYFTRESKNSFVMINITFAFVITNELIVKRRLLFLYRVVRCFFVRDDVRRWVRVDSKISIFLSKSSITFFDFDWRFKLSRVIWLRSLKVVARVSKRRERLE